MCRLSLGIFSNQTYKYYDGCLIYTKKRTLSNVHIRVEVCDYIQDASADVNASSIICRYSTKVYLENNILESWHQFLLYITSFLSMLANFFSEKTLRLGLLCILRLTLDRQTLDRGRRAEAGPTPFYEQ